MGYSVGFALTALLLALAVGICRWPFFWRLLSRLGALLDPLFMLPLSTSAVTLGFGFIIALAARSRISPWLVPWPTAWWPFRLSASSAVPAEHPRSRGGEPFGRLAAQVWRRPIAHHRVGHALRL